MADYAPNFTARVKVTYSFEGDTHENTTRWPSANTQAANITLVSDFWSNLMTATAGLRHTSFSILGVEYAQADSNVFLPAGFESPMTAGTRAAATGASSRIMHSIWAGRSALGSRTRFQMFGLFWASAEDVATDNFYITVSENSLVGTIAALIGGSGMVGPDDEDIVLVRPRVAYKQNDAWVSVRRKASA